VQRNARRRLVGGFDQTVHEREDETWFVLGEYTFEVGCQTFRAGPGGYVFGPRHVPHSYANRTEAVARALIMVTPAGFEGFWHESANLTGDAGAHKTLGEKYGGRQLTREDQRQY
jgi:hypothetical protein